MKKNIKVEIELRDADIDYIRHPELEVDVTDISRDTLRGFYHEVRAVWATGVDKKGASFRVNIIDWLNATSAIEEGLDDNG